MRCELMAGHPDFRSLATIAGIQVDLRYAGTDNFVGRNLYGGLDCNWVHREAALALEVAVAWLRTGAPGLALLVLDAVRPQRVQNVLWQHLAGTGMQQYLADPAQGSIHSFGMALDVTLVDAGGVELDMGTAFDAMSELSHPQFEERHFAAGLLTASQINNRRILRQAMAAGHFQGILSEWWHFDLGDRVAIRRNYLRVD